MGGFPFDFDDETVLSHAVAVDRSGGSGAVKDPGAAGRNKIPCKMSAAGNGFSRETSEYIKQNKAKYVVDTPNGPRLLMSILQCPKESVKNEVADIQFNVPELFIEDWMA